jgi:DNA repair photolyase
VEGSEVVDGGQAAPRLRWATVEDQDALALPGLGERISHPEFAGVEFVHVRAKSLLNHVPAAAGMPFEWTINVYRGCTHACGYCFARPSHTYLELDADREFESVIVVKVNAVERLRAELRAPSWRGAHVALGTNTDPYQRCEGRYRLTRGVLATLAEAGNRFSVLTKGTLVTRDLDVLAEAARRGVCTGVSLSIPTLDEVVWRATEPGTPHPRARLEAVAALAEAGVPAGVFVAPIIPELSDRREQLDDVVRGALDAGASSIVPIVLHLRPGVREVFLRRLRDHDPALADRLARRYRGTQAPSEVRRRLVGTVDELVRRHGGPRAVRGGRARGLEPDRPRPTARAEPATDTTEQLALAVTPRSVASGPEGTMDVGCGAGNGQAAASGRAGRRDEPTP